MKYLVCDNMRWIVNDLEDLKRVAGEFLAATEGKRIFALDGPMGVGKTTFVKAVAEVLGVEDAVTSPTFAIVNEYKTKAGDTVYHFDCYRLKNLGEAMDMGCEEYFDCGARCFVEWPELIEPLLPEDALVCRFSELLDGRRVIEFAE